MGVAPGHHQLPEQLDLLDQEAVSPVAPVVAEFDDSALMKTFGQDGVG